MNASVKSSPLWRRSTLALALLAAFGAGCVAPTLNPISSAHAFGDAAPSAERVATPDFAALVEQYGPAVVNVQVEGTVKTVSPLDQMAPDDPLREFLRRFGQIPAPLRRQPMRGEGSGFIVRSDGIILTNAHVVDNADTVTVRLTDRRELKAKVLGVDKPTDVAVLKIDAKDLPTVKLGDPNKTRVGDWVLAIGSPFGFENSVSAGIVSAKSRSLPQDNYVPFLQTDVPINPGNSGGPLFNGNGEVIGINSQIYSRSGGYQGISFAIPIDVALKVGEQIIDHGKVTRGRLGVAIQDVSAPLAAAFGLKTPHGALVSSVEPGSAGDKAGLKAGDIITELDGQTVERSNDLPPRIADTRPGSSVTLTVVRQGEEKKLSATVGSFSDKEVDTASNDGEQGGRLGLAVRPLSPQEQRDSDLDGGLLVQQVGGAAERAGVQPGDVILALNGHAVKSIGELRSLLEKAGKQVALLIQRGDARIFVPVELG